jgi:hypothetical protein
MKFKHIILLAGLFICGYTNAQVPSYVPTNGLVGWWPFNGNANDESGNGNNGIVNGATLTVDRFGNANKAYNFDGINDFINCGVISSLNNSSYLSISAWFKYNSIHNSSRIIGAEYVGNANLGWGLALDNYFTSGNAIKGVVRNTNVLGGLAQLGVGPQNLQVGNNYHAIMIFDGTAQYNKSKLRLYINGIQQTLSFVDSIPSSLPTSNFKTIIGNEDGAPDCPWDGILDDIGIWNRALSSSEIQQLYTIQAPCTLTNNFFATDTISACGNSVTLNAQNAGAAYSWSTNATTQTINVNTSGWYKCTVSQGSTCSVTDSIYVSLPNALPASLQTGLVGYWPFCGNANDESGNGNNGSGLNGVQLSTDRYGKSNNAYEFDGVDDYLQCLNAGPSGTGITLSYWYKTSKYITTGNTVTDVFSYGGNSWGTLFEANYNHWSAQTAGPCFGPALTSAGTLISRGSTQIPDSTKWHQAVIVLPVGATSLNAVRFFLDGVELTGTCSFANYGAPAINIGSYYSIRIGMGYQNNGLNFKGKLDDFIIWNRELNNSEIQQLYTSQSANLASNNTSTNNANPGNLPNGISYQAIARDSLGQPLTNTNVEVRFTLRDSSVTGAVVYKETHALTTNQFGLFTTAIGSGNAQSGVYANINWMGPAKFLDVELKQGSNYVLLGSQQLLAVPYANAANAAGKIKNAQVPVYADNAAALAGGLQVGEMYRTPSGALMIVY